jgi:hypothetical protein
MCYSRKHSEAALLYIYQMTSIKVNICSGTQEYECALSLVYTFVFTIANSFTDLF